MVCTLISKGITSQSNPTENRFINKHFTRTEHLDAEHSHHLGYPLETQQPSLEDSVFGRCPSVQPF